MQEKARAALEFGEPRMLVEIGQHHNNTGVYRRKHGGKLNARVRGPSGEVKDRSGELLAD